MSHRFCGRAPLTDDSRVAEFDRLAIQCARVKSFPGVEVGAIDLRELFPISGATGQQH
jgi:hypothetical protein